MKHIRIHNLTKPYLEGYWDFHQGKKYLNPYVDQDANEYLDGYIHLYRHLDDKIMLPYCSKLFKKEFDFQEV